MLYFTHAARQPTRPAATRSHCRSVPCAPCRGQHNWLDFVVAEENGKRVAQSIGKFYHAVVVLNAALAVAIGQARPLE